MHEFAPDPPAFDLNDGTSVADDYLVQLFEAVDPMTGELRQVIHR